MDRKNIENYVINIASHVIDTIDLNYILAEARIKNYSVCLITGDYIEGLIWYNDKCELSYDYEMSANIIHQYLLNNISKIVKMNISSPSFDIYPINRNIILYVPYKIDMCQIKKNYDSIVHHEMLGSL